MKTAYGSSKIEIWVDCPHCQVAYDLMEEHDHEDLMPVLDKNITGFMSAEDFNLETQCPNCKKEFIVEEVVY